MPNICRVPRMARVQEVRPYGPPVWSLYTHYWLSPVTRVQCSRRTVFLRSFPSGLSSRTPTETLRKGRLNPSRGPPMTLGGAPARLRLLVWCKGCGHRSEPDPVEQARWYGPETTVPEWRRRLVCSKCGSRAVDMVVDGARR